jgi:hypothetical protein
MEIPVLGRELRNTGLIHLVNSPGRIIRRQKWTQVNLFKKV